MQSAGTIGRRVSPARQHIGLPPAALPVALAVALSAVPAAPRAVTHAGVRDVIEARVEALVSGLEMGVRGESIHSAGVLERFYPQRLAQPVWSDGERVAAIVADLLSVLRRARDVGMDPRRYHLPAIEALVARIGENPGEKDRARLLADLDLLCTDAFLIHARHLAEGVVDPETIDPDWEANGRGIDLEPLLESLAAGTIRATLDSLAPSSAGYVRLREALREYREIADRGGWPPVSPGKKLEPGSVDPRVKEVRETLVATGDLPRTSPLVDDFTSPVSIGLSPHRAPDPLLVFDEELKTAVMSFQRRHGLDPDGVIGKATWRALNVPARQRVRQIEVNLERWRWLSRDLGERYVAVNVPGFSATVVERDSVVMEMRVIVGQRYRRTPVFSARMSYLVLGPYWEVPPKLAVEDKLPEIRKDPSYLARQGIRVLQGWGDEAIEIDPATVDWESLDAEHFPYRFRQDPGPLNALGRVKFMFPNAHQVYLHDTPQRALFGKASRTFSSGCIRVENALDLAVYLLADQPRWSRVEIERVMKTGTTTTIPITRRVAVHLLYWTAWMSADAVVHFREDIYDRDRRIHEALVAPSGAEPRAAETDRSL